MNGFARSVDSRSSSHRRLPNEKFNLEVNKPGRVKPQLILCRCISVDSGVGSIR